LAGTIVADNLMDGAGNSTAMDNAIYGSAKAWVNYNGVTQTVRASYNVSSVTYNSTGLYTVNFTNAMVDANYVTVTSSRPTSDAAYNISHIAPTALSPAVYSSSAVTVRTAWANAGNNPDICTVAVFR